MSGGGSSTAVLITGVRLYGEGDPVDVLVADGQIAGIGADLAAPADAVGVVCVLACPTSRVPRRRTVRAPPCLMVEGSACGATRTRITDHEKGML